MTHIEIAKFLEMESLRYPSPGDVDVPRGKKATFKIGTLTIRGEATDEAIERVARKFRSRKPRGTYTERKAYLDLKTIGPYDWRNTK